MPYGYTKHKAGTPRGVFAWIMDLLKLIGIILLAVGIFGANDHIDARQEVSHHAAAK